MDLYCNKKLLKTSDGYRLDGGAALLLRDRDPNNSGKLYSSAVRIKVGKLLGFTFVFCDTLWCARGPAAHVHHRQIK